MKDLDELIRRLRGIIKTMATEHGTGWMPYTKAILVGGIDEIEILRKENEALIHDIQRALERETSLLNEVETLRNALMATATPAAIKKVGG